MRWGFRSCGSDHGLCPLDSHKPLKRLDRNFYMGVLLLLFRSLGFVLCCDRGGLLFYGCGKLNAAAPQKNKKNKSHNYLTFFKQKYAAPNDHYHSVRQFLYCFIFSGFVGGKTSYLPYYLNKLLFNGRGKLRFHCCLCGIFRFLIKLQCIQNIGS